MATLKEIAEGHLPGWHVTEPALESVDTGAETLGDLSEFFRSATPSQASRLVPASSATGPSGLVELESPDHRHTVLLIKNGKVIAEQG